MHRIEIPGKPVSKGRPRAATDTCGNVRMYTPQKTVNFENLVKLCSMEQANDLGIGSETPVSVYIDAFWPSKNPPRKRNPRRMEPRPSGEDVDNIAKSILDGMQSVVFNNDSSVVDLRVCKWFAPQGEAPRTEVMVDEFSWRRVRMSWYAHEAFELLERTIVEGGLTPKTRASIARLLEFVNGREDG